MTDQFGQDLRKRRTEQRLSLAQLAQLIPCHRAYLAQIEKGERRPSPEFACKLDEVLRADGALVATLQSGSAARPAPPYLDTDELDTMELARRVEASDLSNTTLSGLEAAVDRLAVAYQSTSPSDLLPDIRRYLKYVGQLVDKPATLRDRQRLLVVGAWLSLLGAIVDVDLRRRTVANARLLTAASLADHTSHTEIAAWCLETRAWDALTDGRFRLAVELSRGAQQVAPDGGSAFIQSTAQEGRAWSRLGDRREAQATLARVEKLVSPRTNPDIPEHHFQYDPAKQLAYTVTTLSWIADPAAETYAREVLARLESGRDGGLRHRRIATARLDLALVLSRTGNLDEAAGLARLALLSGRIVASSAWRAAEVVEAVDAADLAESHELKELLAETVPTN